MKFRDTRHMQLLIVTTGVLVLIVSSCKSDRGTPDPTARTGDVNGSSASSPTAVKARQRTGPQSLTAGNGGDTKIELTWHPPSDNEVFTYRVYRSFYSGVEPRQSELDKLVASGLTRPSYLDTGLAPGFTYYYVVTADSGSGRELPPSKEATCRTPGIATDAPAPAEDAGAVVNLDGSVDLYWTTGSEGTTRYNVYRSDREHFVADQSTLLAGNIRGDHHHDFPPPSKVIWFYQVAAVGKAGKETFPSPQFSVQTGGYSYGPAPANR